MSARFNGDNRIETTHVAQGIASYSFWMQTFTVGGPTQRIFGSDGSYELRITGDEFFIDFLQGGGPNTNINIQTDTWYHIIVTVDNTADEVFLYVNGALEAQNLSATDPADATPFYIGTSPQSTTQALEGDLEDFRIYDRVLTTREIETIYASRGTDQIVNGLTSRMLFNQGSIGSTITTVQDLYGNIVGTANSSGGNPDPTYQESPISYRRRFK